MSRSPRSSTILMASPPMRKPSDVIDGRRQSSGDISSPSVRIQTMSRDVESQM